MISDKWVKSLLFAIWPLVLTVLLITGNYQTFLATWFWPFLTAGTIIFIMFLIYFLQEPSTTMGTTGRWSMIISFLILISPAVFILKSMNEELGHYTMKHRRISEAPVRSYQSNRPLRATPTPTSLPKSYGVYMDDTDPQMDNQLYQTDINELILSNAFYHQRRVEVTGKVFNEPNSKNGFVLFRFLITCCAADSIPRAVTITGNRHMSLTNDQWVKVTGRFRHEMENGRYVFYIDPEEVVGISRPSKKALYLD